MTTRVLMISVGLSLLCCMFCANLEAQPKNFKEKRESRLEILTMWRLMEELDLDKETADSIFEIRREFLKKRRSLTKDINHKIQALEKALDKNDTPNDEQAIKKTLDVIKKKRSELIKLWGAQYEEMSKLLTIRQQAKLVIFMKSFRKELKRLRDFARRSRGQGPRPPHDQHRDRPARALERDFRGGAPEDQL